MGGYHSRPFVHFWGESMTLQELRRKAGFLTPELFAAAAGISFMTVRRAEKQQSISVLSAIRIAKALGLENPNQIDGLKFTAR